MSNARYGLRTLTLGEVRTLARRNVFQYIEEGFFSLLFGVPDAAYSLRKLTPNANYSGAAIRVRRSNDNAEQDIDFINSSPDAGIDTTDLLNFVGAGNDGFVTTWYDQSGNGLHGTQTTGNLQPKIVNSGTLQETNSEPSILFADDSEFVLSSNLSPNTVITLAKVNTISLVNYLTFSTVQSGGHFQAGTFSGVDGIGVFDGSTTGTTNVENTNQNLSFFNYNGTNYEIGINGASYVSVTNTNLVQVNRIGRTSFNLSLNGPYQELIIYGTSVTGDKAAIETNINDYYNVF